MIRVLRDRRGVTLAELMVATVILSIGVVGAMGSFRYITKAIAGSRIKTIAANLAQEKMEVLKNQPYFQLTVTTDQVTSSGYNPNFTYDADNYVEAPITLWGLPPLNRVVEVDYAQVNGLGVSTVPFSSNDTGMKLVTVTVYWTENDIKKKVQFSSYYENPSVAVLDTGFSGTVSINGGGGNLAGAYIQVIGTPKWRATSASDGSYSFQVAPGSYTLVCSSAGFYSATSSLISVNQGTYASQNFSLLRVASGTVAAKSVYSQLSDLLISNVMASSSTFKGTAGGGITPATIEYFELFNGTTHQINVTNVGSTQKYYLFNFSGKNPAADQADVMTNKTPATFVSTYVASGSYYLLANASFFLQNNWVQADAYYTGNLHAAGDCGGFQVTTAAGNIVDQVGWNSSSCEAAHPLYINGTIIPTATGIGSGNQIVRYSSACYSSGAYGRAYDTRDNRNNFHYNTAGIEYQVKSLASGAFTIISGRPATGGRVFADDGNSAGAATSDFTLSGTEGQTCPVSSFTLVGVGTGTWDVSGVTTISSQMVTGVVVAQNATTMIENAVTTPSWPVSGLNYMALISSITGGFAAGVVKGAGADFDTRLSNIVVASSDGQLTRTDSQGYFFLTLSTGSQTVSANYDNSNPNYVSQNQGVTISQGVITTMSDFHLNAGGYIKGYVTSGTGALPNVVVQATNGGGQTFTDTSDNTGYFYIFASTSALPYTVKPVLDVMSQYSSAASNNCSLVSGDIQCNVTTPGATLTSSTITVTGALGTIKGNVTANGSLITTGVLVLVSTASISDPPAAVVASSAPALTTIYAASSQADGTYSVSVRASTATYNMRAFYPVVNPDTGGLTQPASQTLTIPGGVSAGATLTGRNFAW